MDRRANSHCSGRVRRSWDHWIVAVSVRWRSAPVRRPLSRRKRPSRRDDSSVGERLRVRAAASSMASGMPSRRRQISATACRLATASNVLATARACSSNSSTPASVASGLISTRRSPPIASGSREVASTRVCGQFSATARASALAATITCSQLSRITSASRDRNAVTIDSVSVRPGVSVTPIASATARGTSAGSPTSASSISHPSPVHRCAAAIASRVLPIPPGPTRVTTGWVASASSIVWTSVPRPISGPSCRGRLPGL